MAAPAQNFYPHLVVDNNKKPNKFLAFPFLGILVKFILLIPVGIEMFFLSFFSIFVLFITWFVISFTGKYWDFAYRFFLGYMRLETKIYLYVYGITDKYPGFTFSTNGILTLDVTKPEKPNRWLAVPFVGLFIRFILSIPYLIFSDVLGRGSGIAMFLSWFVVLFKGRLPESFYEFEKDTLRVANASSVYLLGLSDKYPSFSISMNHQTAKILLIIVGAILSAFNLLGSFAPSENATYDYNNDYNYEYQYDSAPESDTDVDYNTY